MCNEGKVESDSERRAKELAMAERNEFGLGAWVARASICVCERDRQKGQHIERGSACVCVCGIQI